MWRSAGVFCFPAFFWPVGAALASDEIFRPARRPLFHVLAARIASELITEKPSEQRAQGMPGARCTRSLACKIKQADRKSTRLNSSHQIISYAVFCLKK